MTRHLDDELLAQWALDGQPDDAAAADHLQLCDRCRTSLGELRSLVAVSKTLPSLEQPDDSVWQRIVEEVSTPPSSEQVVLDQRSPEGPDHPLTDEKAPSSAGTNRRFRRPTLALAACIAALLGVGAGIIGTLLVTRDGEPDQPVAEVMVKLAPLTGKTGGGSADLIREPSGTRLKVDAAGLAAANGYYEVWLINVDGKRMVSLGVLNPQTGGTFQVPPDLTAQGYRIVDVSLEPDDGNPVHSLDSIIRGTLPA
ncbi:anti-sigma factor [Kribbella sp. NPDC023855]|uniref:anti-sigma factor n=1 Tax=Kribbella sp. NPDC023855 TaxID=3154698 RepID=UPI00340E7344